jgi:hypothetical protein
MFEHIEPNFFFESSHWLAEKKFQESKWYKIGNRMRLTTIYFQYLRIQKKLSCSSRSFVYVWAEIFHKSKLCYYLTRKFLKNWGKKLNVKCDIDENFIGDQGFSHFFLLLCSASSWEPNYWIKMHFFLSILMLFTLIYCSTELKEQPFTLFQNKMRKMQALGDIAHF